MRRVFKNVILSAAFVSMSSLALAGFENPKPLTNKEVWKTVKLFGVTYKYRGELYQESNGLAIFEGDIILGEVEEVENQIKKQNQNLLDFKSNSPGGERALGTTFSSLRWPNGLIPYEFDVTLPELSKTRFLQAIAEWQENTVIQFVERTPANSAQFPNFIHVIPHPEDNVGDSYVGMIGKGQKFRIGKNFSYGNIMHEIGHAAGLRHEQSRGDRDQWITINAENIDPNHVDQFNKIEVFVSYYGTPYDYGSIMHYHPCGFSIDSNNNNICDVEEQTMTALKPLPPGVVLGQREALSGFDILAIGNMYGAIADSDGDEHLNLQDNCPKHFNPTQADEDKNGIGDACELAWLPAVTDLLMDKIANTLVFTPTK